ncbi:hypothetical protein ACFZAR_40700 [Streptomyces sp. NPDC008222]|uniref:hypothetical protein n=1 Tax=Streptomyces sp. NPDC008222 TaxID=3364820 RepID=UPI0036E397C5
MDVAFDEYRESVGGAGGARRRIRFRGDIPGAARIDVLLPSTGKRDEANGRMPGGI